MTASASPHDAGDELAAERRRAEVCVRFEKALLAGERPRIETAYLEVPESERPALVYELVGVELDLRLATGEQPTPEEYCVWFPELAASILRLFKESEPPRSPPRHRKDGPTDETGPLPKADPSYNLLFGLLALQNNFIDRDALLAAFNTWIVDKNRAIGQLLVERGILNCNRHALLEALVQEHLKQHDDDPRQSLAVLSSIGSIRDDLAKLGDLELANSLEHVSIARSTGSTLPYGLSVTASWSGDAVTANGRYRVLRHHAQGGLGVVSVALDEELNREVAVKEIRGPNADDPQTRARFEREAEVTGCLEHPGIVPVYAVGKRANGRPFYIMRFVHGAGESNSLKAAIQELHFQSQINERSPSLRQLLRRFIVACQAIDYAHSRGVLHRDIKPGNIMLGKHGETLVVDWGLAKPLGHRESTANQDEQTLHPHSDEAVEGTQRGSTLGTPGYMSPEQAAGRHDELGPRSDIYSLGATLYNLLTGHSPFEGDNYSERLKKNERGEFPAPREVCSWVPRPLEAVCLKAMALKPENRFESARALAKDIERWMDDEAVSASREPIRDRVARWARHHKPLMAGVLVLSLAVPTSLAVISVIWTQRNAAQREKLAQEYLYLVEPPEEAARKPGWTWKRMADLQRAAGLDVPQRSPARLRSELADCLAAVDVREADPRYRSLLAMGHDASCLAFSPDGRFLALGQCKTTVPVPFRVLVVDLEETTVRPFAIPPPWSIQDRHEGARALAFSPRGEGLIVGTRYGWIHYLDLTAPESRPQSWPAHKGSVTGLMFDPDGKWFVSGSEDRTVKRWDLSIVKAGRAPVFDSLGFEAGVSGLRAIPDSRRVACLTGGQIVLVDAGIFRKLSNHLPTGVDRFTAAPDGRTLAASLPAGEGSEGRQVVTLDLEHGDEVRSFHDPALLRGESHLTGHLDLEFSPDGSLLATASEDDQDRSVKLWEVASGRLLVTFPVTGSSILDTCFSPDGRFLAVTSAAGAALYELGGLTAQTSLAHQSHPISAVGLEPKGRKLACVAEPRNPSGRACDPDVSLWDTTAGKRVLRRPVVRKKSSDYCTSILFQSDGLRLASSWTSNRIVVIDAATGHEVTTICADDPVALGLSPDGSRVWAAAGSNVRSWSVSGWKENSTWSNNLAAVMSGRLGINCLAISHEWVIAGGSDGAVKMLSGSDGSHTVGGWSASSVPLRSVAYSPENQLIAAGALDGTVALFRPTGDPIARLDAHRESVETIQFSPGGRLMATGSRDRTVRLWAIAGGTVHELLTLSAPTGPVHSIAFSEDGQRLFIVVRGDLAVRVWHLDRLRKCLRPLKLDWD